MLFNMPGLGEQIKTLIRTKPDIIHIKPDIANLLYFFINYHSSYMRQLSEEHLIKLTKAIIPELDKHIWKIFDYLANLLLVCTQELADCQSAQETKYFVLHVFMLRTALNTLFKFLQNCINILDYTEIKTGLDTNELQYLCIFYFQAMSQEYHGCTIKQIQSKLKSSKIISKNVKKYLTHSCRR